MKQPALFLFSLSFPFVLLNSEGNVKKKDRKDAKETQEWGTQQLQQLLENDFGLGIDQKELLPLGDKDKEFEIGQAKPEEVKSFIGTTAKLQKFEGTEQFFQKSREVLENPEGSVGIKATESKHMPAEEKLFQCQETGTYQISFNQKRIVKPAPTIKNQTKECKGHFQLLNETFFWESSAKEKAKTIKKDLSKDPTLKSFDTNLSKAKGGFKNWYVMVSWHHKDNSPNCPSYQLIDTVTSSTNGSEEKDYWETDSPESLAVVESNPNCHLLYAQVTEGPGVKMIEGQSVFKDQWGRQLFFSCEPTDQSPCAQFRMKGGTLVKKKCLKETPFGECDLWEKTYDLGKKAASVEEVRSFSEEELWGLNQEFDASYEKNGEFTTALSTLSLFSDLKKEMEDSGKEVGAGVEIFRGEEKKCQCSFASGVLYDCCKKMSGLAVATYLARCNSEEQSLAEQRHAGKCHYVGSKKEQLGTQTTRVFCCFPTKLAKILHEEGRKQLRIDWGDVDHPQCRGFSLEEVQRIDLTKIDFSDVIEDISIDKEALLNKMQSTIDQLQSKGEEVGKARTDRILQKQQEVRSGL